MGSNLYKLCYKRLCSPVLFLPKNNFSKLFVSAFSLRLARRASARRAGIGPPLAQLTPSRVHLFIFLLIFGQPLPPLGVAPLGLRRRAGSSRSLCPLLSSPRPAHPAPGSNSGFAPGHGPPFPPAWQEGGFVTADFAAWSASRIRGTVVRVGNLATAGPKGTDGRRWLAPLIG